MYHNKQLYAGLFYYDMASIGMQIVKSAWLKNDSAIDHEYDL